MLSETKLEMKSKKYAQNVLKLIPLDLRITSFRIEELQKTDQIGGAGKFKQVSKNGCRNITRIHDTWTQEHNKKR